MDTLRICKSCQAPLPKDSPEGLCPQCLLKIGIEATVTLASAPQIPNPHLSAVALAKAESTIPNSKVHYFGDYELIEEIARGGMGVVWKARQVSLNRIVAVKMILAGKFASDADVKRFYTEAEAAANLDHPNIVPIYEVGEHEGRHYFSMKLVEGGDLAAKLEDFSRNLYPGIELLAKVSHAVHYAHQRGILHRDLKPANILLNQLGEPHVTDFGLAKLVNRDSGLTRTAAVMGTPAYMAPEQALGRAKEISTSTDVYSLGAILYQVLTGKAPFHGATPLETMHQVVEDEPIKPSTLNRKVDRDLETICLKCLEKDSKRRYASADALAEDLERWLRQEPILARPITSRERVIKWAKRKPAFAVMTTAMVVLAIAGVLGIEWQRRAAVEARAKAEQRAITSDQIVGFFEGMLLSGKTDSKQEKETLNNMLDQAAASIGAYHVRRWKDASETRGATWNPKEIEVELRGAIGLGYMHLNEPQKAEEMYRKTVELRRALSGDEDSGFADSLTDLSGALVNQGKYPDAETLERQALRIRRKASGEDSKKVAESLSSLSGTLWAQHKLNEAEAFQREELALRKRLADNDKWGNEDWWVIQSLRKLAHLLEQEGKLAESEAVRREALATSRRNAKGRDSRMVAEDLSDLGGFLFFRDRKAEAEAPLREALAIRQKLEPGKTETFEALWALGACLVGQKKFAEAEPLLVSAYEGLAGLKSRESTMPVTNDAVIRNAIPYLIQLYAEWGKLDKVEEWKQRLASFGQAEKPGAAQALPLK